MTARRFGGLAVLLAVVIVAAGVLTLRGGIPGLAPEQPVQTVRGYVGGEKMSFLQDERVAAILRQRHGLAVEAVRAGSVEMVLADPAGRDFLWPAEGLHVELYKERQGRLVKAEGVFNSPIVLYAHREVAEALRRQGLVTEVDDVAYVDLPRLIALIEAGTTWEAIGLGSLYGKVSLKTTDPAKSASGNLFAGLLANLANGGAVVDDHSIDAALPRVQRFYAALGQLPSSSGELFNQFLKQGVGANPMIIGYENQLIEFVAENEDSRAYINERIRVLYPRPTTWSTHPVIALTPSGAKLLDALRSDAELQRVAWERHGLRSGIVGVTNDPKVLKLVGIPGEIQAVMPLPRHTVMARIIEALR